MRVVIIAGIFLVAGAASASDIPTIVKSYNYTDADFAERDSSCISAFVKHIISDFEGITRISFENNFILQTSNGFLAVYAGTKFRSKFGNAEGTVNCVFASDGKIVTDVAITFEGKGLAGNTRRPLTKIFKNRSPTLDRMINNLPPSKAINVMIAPDTTLLERFPAE